MANIARLLHATIEQNPDRPAVISDGTTLSYAQFGSRISQIAGALASDGCRPGDRIVLCMTNSRQYLELLHSCFQLGLVVVPVNARCSGDELAFHIADSEAAAVFVDRERQRLLRKSPQRVSARVYVIDDELEAMAEAALDSVNEPVTRDETDPAWLFYTSGTTGKPKGATLTHRNIEAMALLWLIDVVPMTARDVTLHAAPLSHASGLMSLSVTAVGACNVVPTWSSFDPGSVLTDVARHGVTNLFLVPTQIRMLLESPALDSADLSSLHTIVYGGAPIHVEDLREAITRFPGRLVQAYAQGETPMTATVLPREAHRADASDETLSSAGHARIGMQVRIVDADDRPVGPGDVGEIVVSGPTVMSGYWNKPEATADTIRGGWLHTGDLGRQDERGTVWVLDRAKDMIITGGSNVYAREVEEVILELAPVKAVAVVGIPDRKWGEVVTAVVVADPDLADDEVVAHCERRLASYKKPRSVYFVDGLPLSAYGKVLKRELRAQITSGELITTADKNGTR